jgi:membrane-associated phospholipid phosphatase
VFANWREWRLLAAIFIVPATFMAVATVYCQMHYAVDALAGLIIAVLIFLMGSRLKA